MSSESSNRTIDRRAVGGRLKVPEGSERALGALGCTHLQQLSPPDTPRNSALTGSIPVSATNYFIIKYLQNWRTRFTRQAAPKRHCQGRNPERIR